MTESAAFLVGILGNLLARHIDPARRSLAESISQRLSQGGIPPNHDVEKACRLSLGQALQFFAQTLDLYIAVPQTIKEAFANRKDAEGKWKPLIEWWHTDQRGWFMEFLKAVESDEALAEFRLPAIARASDLNPAIRSLDHEEWSRQFSAELLRWTEQHTPFEQRPGCFDTWAKEGWPVSQDDPEATITLYQAWSLFLQDHFKTDDKVRAILTADWLASIDSKLAALPFSAADLTNAIREPLEERLSVLPALLGSVQRLSAGVFGLEEQSGVLLGLMLDFGKDVHGFREAVLGQGAATHKKLDASLANEEEMKAMLRQLLEAQSIIPVRSSASASVPVVRLIARSKLLEADGASRYERLVGRGREKAALTRAWRQDGLNVLIFVAWGGVGKTCLVTDWITQLQQSDWPGVDAFFDWSFYSQGTKDQSTASSDLFFRSALRHFGETALADSSDSLEVKADRLAEVIRARRILLVLDGIEPLQHPRKKGQEEGRLKDGGIETLLRRLAEPGFSGLCIVTTRVPVIDLKRYRDTTVRECELSHLSVRHGAELLHLAGACFAGQQEITADDEALRTTAIEVKGHAMTLQMLGGYLASAHEGDVLRRDRVDFSRIFADQMEGHAYNVMAAYEEWFQSESEGDRGQRQLSVLHMMGLFDRAADADCIAALRKDGGIAGVSDVVAGLTETKWTQTLHLLSKHRLAFSDRQTHTLDAHPLIREYFAKHLLEKQADGFKAAHSRLFDHLCARTEHRPATLEGLQPLYQAVVHGCLAGRSRRQSRRFTSTASCGAPGAAATIANSNSEPSARIWGRWRRSSRRRGVGSRRT